MIIFGVSSSCAVRSHWWLWNVAAVSREWHRDLWPPEERNPIQRWGLNTRSFCIAKFYFILFYFYFYFILLYNTEMVLPYIDMNQSRVYMSSQSWTHLPPPTPYHLSGSSPCTSPKPPVSCIEHRLEIRFLHDSIHVSMPLSQIIPPSPSPSESKSPFYTSVSLLLSCIQGYHYHLSKFHIYVLVYCIGVFLSGLLHSV